MGTDGFEGGTVLRREFTFWSSFAISFAFISPIVALYSIFGLAISTAGPPFWWGFVIVFAGQLLVALVFAMLVSKWPYEGSIYQWSRRLVGPRYGWFAGWTYQCSLIIGMTTLALATAGFTANVVGVEHPSGATTAWIALLILIAGTALNMTGRRVLRVFVSASIVAEVIGSVGLAIWLLLFHRVQPLSVLVDGQPAGSGDYLSIHGPFLIALIFIGFSFVGFESAGAIAEEVHEPDKSLPKAIIRSLTLIAVVVMFSSLAIILAIPDMRSVTDGDVADPVYYTLTNQLGEGIARPLELLFAIGFMASFLAVQTSASRMIWSFARDNALPGSRILVILSRKQRQPVNALMLTTAIGAALLLLSNFASNIYSLMVNFTAGSFFLSFLFPLVGALVVQVRRQWCAGRFSLGRGTLLITVAAVMWTALELINIAWPRKSHPETYLDWSVLIGVVFLAGLGIAVFAIARPPLETREDPVQPPTVASNDNSVVNAEKGDQ